ncbi:hypothetical protein ACLOJK_040869, partial [Asimina triloba]
DALETIFSLCRFAAHPHGCWILGRLHRLGADFVSSGVPRNGDELGDLEDAALIRRFVLCLAGCLAMDAVWFIDWGLADKDH